MALHYRGAFGLLAFRGHDLCRLGVLVALIFTLVTVSPLFPQRSRNEMQRRAFGFEREWTEFSINANALLHARLDWGTLTGIDANKTAQAILYAIRRHGPRESITFQIPDAGFVNVYDVTAGPDGSLALVGSCLSNAGQAGAFVARISRDRQRQSIVQTWPFIPVRVAVASDGTVWTAGMEKDPQRDPYDERVQDNVFRRYDNGGKLLGTFVARGRSSPGVRGNAVDASYVRASRDRIAWLTNGMEYIEFSLDGRESGRYEGPPVPKPSTGYGMSIALSKSNEVMVGVEEEGVVNGRRLSRAKWSLWMLDRKQRAWFPVELTGARRSPGGILLGFEGSSLLILDGRWITSSFRPLAGEGETVRR